MIDQHEYATGVAEVARQVAGNCGKPDHGLLLHLPTVGPIRAYEGDGVLLLSAGDRQGDSLFPALLDTDRVEELRDFLTAWLDGRAGGQT